MKFFWKVFLAVLITTSSLGALLIWASYSFVEHWTTEEYISRYSSFSTVLGDALANLDSNTEFLMRNAAEIVAQEDHEHGLLSTDRLKRLRQELNVTQIFVQNKNGTFIRSTNNDVERIPNAFSFCGEYRKLITGEMASASTPLVLPAPNPATEPYKFLYIPNRAHNRLIEVGLRVDSVAETLTKALGADPNLISVSLYSPLGQVLGRFSSAGVQYSSKSTDLPENLPQMVDRGNTFRYFVKIPSSHPKCCECDVSKTSKNGEYYYVLESEISKAGLKTVQASMHRAFALLAVILLGLSLLISRFISRRLVANIEAAVRKVKAIMSGDSDRRIHLSGGDEIKFLTDQFDSLLDQFEDSQSKLIESEKLKAKVQISREVAHNIKSPTIAIEMVLPLLKDAPKKVLDVLKDSATDIRKLAERLLQQADADDKQSLTVNSSLEAIELKPFLEDLIRKKDLEHNSSYMVLRLPENFSSIVAVDRTEFGAVLSNLINNAIEAYFSEPKAVHIVCDSADSICNIAIKDFGRGIPPEIVDKLGREEVTLGKLNGQGIGVLHAFKTIGAWGGKVKIESVVGFGTTVTLSFPCVQSNRPMVNKDLTGC